MLWKANVPERGRNRLLFVEAPTWFAARDLCRLIHHREALEANWRELSPVDSGSVRDGSKIYYRSPTGEVASKICIRLEPKKRKK